MTIENLHSDTTVALRMNNLSGDAADLKLYAYGIDGKLMEVPKQLWSIKLENGEISREEYDEWRYRYPELDTSHHWAKTPSQEMSDYLIKKSEK